MSTFRRAMCLTLCIPLMACAWEGKKVISQAEAMELVVSKVPPEYPAVARQLNLTGTVEVNVTVGENGAVESATPVSGSPVLTRPAADALKRWKFRPLQENGAAVKFESTFKVTFSK